MYLLSLKLTILLALSPQKTLSTLMILLVCRAVGTINLLNMIVLGKGVCLTPFSFTEFFFLIAGACS